MSHTRNAKRFAAYVLFGVLILSTGCFATARVQIVDNQKGNVANSLSRRLLETREEDLNRVTNSDAVKVIFFGILICIAIVTTVLYCICQGCILCFCPDALKWSRIGTLLDTILNPRPRRARTAVPPTSHYATSSSRGTSVARASSSPALAPPRPSTSVILPIEGEVYPLHLHGIENPLYLPTNGNSGQHSNVVPIPEPTGQNLAPLREVLDMPPSYTTFVSEDHKYPKTSGNR